MAKTSPHRREYMRKLMAKRRQQYREDMALFGTPVVMGRPPKEKPKWVKSERTSKLKSSATFAAKLLGEETDAVAWREFKRRLIWSFLYPDYEPKVGFVKKQRKPPTESELQQAFAHVLESGRWVTGPVEYSRRGNPLVVRFPKHARRRKRS